MTEQNKPHPLTYKLVMTEFHERADHASYVRFFLPFDKHFNGGFSIRDVMETPHSLFWKLVREKYGANEFSFCTLADTDDGKDRSIRTTNDEKTNLAYVQWRKSESVRSDFTPPSALLGKLMEKHGYDFISKLQQDYEAFVLLLPKYAKAYKAANTSQENFSKEAKEAIGYEEKKKDIRRLEVELENELQDEIALRAKNNPALALKQKLGALKEWPDRADKIRVVTDMIED